jgi:hypothetical protein
VLSHFPFSSVILLQFTFIFIFVSDISYILCQSFHICVSHSLFGTVFSHSLFGIVLIHSQVQKVPSNSSCYSDSVIFKILLRATLTHPFLLQRLSHFFRFHQPFFRYHHTLQWLGHFYYRDSAIFRFRRPFLKFRRTLQWLNHFATVLSYFWDFTSYF